MEWTHCMLLAHNEKRRTKNLHPVNQKGVNILTSTYVKIISRFIPLRKLAAAAV